MTLEQQVVSLELAQKLKELGVKQESFFQWINCKLNEDENGKTRSHFLLFTTDDYGQEPQFSLSEMPDWYDAEDFDYGECISAFTVAELGEILKDGGVCSFFQGKWCCTYVSEDGRSHKEGADTEADARAKMFVYLLKNKLIII